MEKIKNVNEMVEEETAIEEMNFKQSLKIKAKDLWNNNKEKIAFGVIIGGSWLITGLQIVHGFKQQRIFNKEVCDKFGPNASHGSIVGGSIKKRRADLAAWERGTRKTEFDKVTKFAKTLDLDDNTMYIIEGFKNPHNKKIAKSIYQQNGIYCHSDWID